METIPALAAIIMSASAGTIVAAFVADMRATREIDAIKALAGEQGMSRDIVSFTRIGLFSGTVVGTVFLGAMTVLGIALYLRMTGDYTLLTALGIFGVAYVDSTDVGMMRVLAAIIESVTYAGVLTYTSIKEANNERIRSPDDVARALQQGLMRTTRRVLTLKIGILLANLHGARMIDLIF